MAVLIVGAGLVGSQIARILVEDGERPVLMDQSAQRQAGAVAMPKMLAGSNLRLAKDVLGFAPKYPMREAVGELAEWTRKNPAR